MNWGYRITFLTLGFVCFMLFLVISAFRQNFDLVSEDYYGKELKFQEQIQRQTNQQQLNDSLTIIMDETKLKINFPNDFEGKKITGEILFFRPSDAKKDLKVTIEPTYEGSQQFPIQLFTKGMYKVQLDYKVSGINYYVEKNIMIN